jgi:hypothetical protein
MKLLVLGNKYDAINLCRKRESAQTDKIPYFTNETELKLELEGQKDDQYNVIQLIVNSSKAVLLLCASLQKAKLTKFFNPFEQDKSKILYVHILLYCNANKQ